MSDKQVITVAYGDGIGPEIMEATLAILMRAGAQFKIETIEIGKKIYENGHNSGISPKSWDALHRNKIFLKAPITTPIGGGYKSLNVTIRKALGLYANVRPAVSYHPYVHTNFPDMDLVVVRENEEDLYAGVEYRLSSDAYEALKIITNQASERISRYGFEYAKAHSRGKVSVFLKDNIMKMTDGAFHKAFNEVSKDYPDIENESYIIDIACARVASKPEIFDVIVTENLYGDIVSDITAEVSGSVGLGGSANIGDEFAMFEAIHGSAPTIAGQNKANPSGLINAAVMMLVHIGQPEVAEKVKNAWLRTLEDGIHTYDISSDEHTTEAVGTKEFADAVIERLGQKPNVLKEAVFPRNNDSKTADKVKSSNVQRKVAARKELVGCDVFIGCEAGQDYKQLISKIENISTDKISLSMVSMRGLKVWPEDGQRVPSLDHTDFARCRFKAEGEVSQNEVVELLKLLAINHLSVAQIVMLHNFDSERGYSLAQGEG